MSTSKDPIGFMGKTNAGVLVAVTPEYSQIKTIRRAGAGRAESRPANLIMQPEYRTIGGTRIRFATGGRDDGPVVLLLCPLPQSILCYDPIWKILQDHCRRSRGRLPVFGRSEGGMEYMSFKAQGDFVEEFVNELGLEEVHVVGPDVGMAAALHYVIHHDHKAASILIGDGPGIIPTSNGSIINKAVDSAFWRMMFRVTGAQAFVEGGYRLACVNYIPCNDEVADYVASYDGRLGPITYWFEDLPGEPGHGRSPPR